MWHVSIWGPSLGKIEKTPQEEKQMIRIMKSYKDQCKVPMFLSLHEGEQLWSSSNSVSVLGIYQPAGLIICGKLTDRMYLNKLKDISVS